MLITILVFLLILSVLVLIHEFGHFIVAKKLGIKVEEFGFGFPPRAFSFKKGETVYSINWFPLGGFVKLYGEDEAGGGKISVKIKDQKSKTKDLERAFFARPIWQRTAVVVAGVVMNALLAIVIFYIFLFITNFKADLFLLSDHKFFGVEQTNLNVNDKDAVIGIVAPDSPAEKAGIKQLSKVLSVNGEKVSGRKELVDIINKNKGKQIELAWEELKTGERLSAKVTPRANPPKGEGSLGIGFPPLAELHYKTQNQKLLSGIVHPINLMSYNFDVMGRIIGISVKERNVEPLGETVSGPLGIFSLVGSILKIPDLKELVTQLLNLTGVLSISLAFFNILPIPALDGGRLLFIVIEAVTGRKMNPKYESMIHTIFFALLLSLIILVTIKDIPMFLKFITGR